MLNIHTFYNGLLYNMRMTLDAAEGGARMNKPYDKAYAFIEDMAQNQYREGANVLLLKRFLKKENLI